VFVSKLNATGPELVGPCDNVAMLSPLRSAEGAVRQLDGPPRAAGARSLHGGWSLPQTREPLWDDRKLQEFVDRGVAPFRCCTGTSNMLLSCFWLECVGPMVRKVLPQGVPGVTCDAIVWVFAIKRMTNQLARITQPHHSTSCSV
jgi:hypothetical protein